MQNAFFINWLEFMSFGLPKSDNVINILQMTKNKKNFVIYNILIKYGLYKYFNAL